MQIVKQDNWDNYILKDGDKLELLDFVGGGWFYGDYRYGILAIVCNR
jgi:hypothetical protein